MLPCSYRRTQDGPSRTFLIAGCLALSWCVAVGVAPAAGEQPHMGGEEGTMQEAIPRPLASSSVDNQTEDGLSDASLETSIATGSSSELVPLVPGRPVHRYTVHGDGRVAYEGVSSGRAAGSTGSIADGSGETAAGGTLIYSNTLGNVVFGPTGTLALSRVADDVVTFGKPGCLLDRYTLRVSGDRKRDGTGKSEYTVYFALHETCPGAGGVVIPGTEGEFAIPAERAGDLVDVTFIPPGDVPLPQSLYVGVRFSRDLCGIVVGAPATTGFSADLLDFPGTECTASLGGFVNERPHASFFLEVYAREDCAVAFPTYRASNHTSGRFTAGVNKPFAQALTLAVPECTLTAYEIAHKGNGIIAVDLRTELLDDDPDNGGLIEGTRTFFFSSGGAAQVSRFDLETPIELTGSDLWIGFKSNAYYAGPIMTCKQSLLGESPNQIMVYQNDAWEARNGSANCHYGLDITIYCDGPPPIGACCETILLHDAACIGGDDEGSLCFHNDQCDSFACIGEASCREVAEFNCPGNRWMEAAACDPDPFDPPCGLGVCCKPDDTCEDLTKSECFAIPPIERYKHWAREQSCQDVGFSCPYNVCIQREGDCYLAHGGAGCQDPACCTQVCDSDPWCCQVAWDEACVRQTTEAWSCISRTNGTGCGRALPLNPNSTEAFRFSSYLRSDPPFCCHDEEPGASVYSPYWFRFVATHETARVHTCTSLPPASDSIMQAYRPVDRSSPEAECDTLELIGCADDSVGCGANENSELCLSDLVPGDTYYVSVGAKTEDTRGVYFLSLESPCTPLTEERSPNDRCREADLITDGETPLDFSLATLECTRAGCAPQERDLWFKYRASCEGLAVIEVIDQSGVPEWGPVLSVYDDCDCTPPLGAPVVCGEDLGFDPSQGAVADVPVYKGQCTLIRVGGELGDISAAMLRVGCYDQCDVTLPSFVDPPGDVVDARSRLVRSPWGPLLGIDRLLTHAGGRPLDGTWSLQETNVNPSLHPRYPRELADNKIAGTVDVGDGTYLVMFLRAITPGEATTVIYTNELGCAMHQAFVALPGDVNGDHAANPDDVAAMMRIMTGKATACWGEFSTDIDHSGVFGPADLLQLIDLLNNGWSQAVTPSPPQPCP